MRQTMRTTLFAPPDAHAGAHRPCRPDRQCLQRLARSKGDRAMCTCIQQAADRTLEPRRTAPRRAVLQGPGRGAAGPHVEIRRDNEFWARYRAFGDMAEAFCAR
jgi:hypothetical protein